MKPKTYAYFNNKGKLIIDVLDKPVFYKSEVVGKIIDNKIEKNGKLLVIIQINKNKVKEINKLLDNSEWHMENL